MVTSLPALDLIDLALAGGLVLLVALGLATQGLPVARQLPWAIGRAIVQLLLLGVFFTAATQDFAPQAWGLGCGLLLSLGIVVVSSRLGRSWPLLIMPVGLALVVSTGFVTVYGYVCLGRGQLPLAYLPVWVGWLLAYTPPVLIQAGDGFLQSLRQNQGAIETQLSLGATGRQVAAVYRRQAWQQSLQPVVQSLGLTGFIALPSAMGGMVWAGIPPLQGAAYQIVLLALMLVQQVLASGLLLWGLGWLAFDRHHRWNDPSQ
jgi:putative ABC transport system permease protein